MEIDVEIYREEYIGFGCDECENDCPEAIAARLEVIKKKKAIEDGINRTIAERCRKEVEMTARLEKGKTSAEYSCKECERPCLGCEQKACNYTGECSKKSLGKEVIDEKTRLPITCKTCNRKDDNGAPLGSVGITFCPVKQTCVPVSSPGCIEHEVDEIKTLDDIVEDDESERDGGELLTCCEYCKSMSDALFSASEITRLNEVDRLTKCLERKDETIQLLTGQLADTKDQLAEAEAVLTEMDDPGYEGLLHRNHEANMSLHLENSKLIEEKNKLEGNLKYSISFNENLRKRIASIEADGVRKDEVIVDLNNDYEVKCALLDRFKELFYKAIDQRNEAVTALGMILDRSLENNGNKTR